MFSPSTLVVASLALLSTLCAALPAGRDGLNDTVLIPDVVFAEVEYTSIVYANIAKRSLTIYSSTYPPYASLSTTFVKPTILSSSILGPATHSPTNSYMAVPTAALPTLASYARVFDEDLTVDYPIYYNGSGPLAATAADLKYAKVLSTVPSYSRDQGRGGQVNGVHIFGFADTNTYTAPTNTTDGKYTGAVSNSFAIDIGMKAADGLPPVIQDPIGAMSAANGALRTYIPFTEGEEAYNNANNGYSRYAIWPESSLIPYTSTYSLLYAPLIWSNISNGVDTYSTYGVTLLKISAPSTGVVVERIVPRLFPGGIDWGTAGGLRSYGSSGTTGGYVYLLGKVNAGISTSGLVIARAAADNVDYLDDYEYYYSKTGWSSTTMYSSEAVNNTFYQGSFSSVDIFYSPRHLTFLMVYMNNYVDNTLYWRYLNAPFPIVPTWAGGNASDIVQYIYLYPWSGQGTLMKLGTPPTSYNYAGGVQLGYFGANDISRGGSKMLFSWTEPNGGAAGSVSTGYYLNTGVATFK